MPAPLLPAWLAYLKSWLSEEHCPSPLAARAVSTNDGVWSVDNMRDPATLTLAFAAAYASLHLLSEYTLVRRRLSKEFLSSLKRPGRLYIAEKVCSSVNGLIVGVAGAYALLHPNSGFSGTYGIFDHYPRYLHLILSSYVGYSVYDMAVMAIAGGEHWSMWAHHFTGAYGAWLMMLYRQMAYFPVAFLITEMTVLPINAIWYYRLFGWDRDAARQAAYQRWLLIRSVVFLVFRSFVAPFSVWWAWHQLGSHSQLSTIRRQAAHISPVVLVATALNVSMLGGLNAWWTVLAVRGLLRGGGGGKKKGKPQVSSSVAAQVLTDAAAAMAVDDKKKAH